MTIESHPDCGRCAWRDGNPKTPAEFMKHLAPSTKEAVELPAEVVAAAADVDALVARYDQTRQRWAASQVAATKLRSGTPERHNLDADIRADWVALDDIDEDLRKARTRYHDLITAFYSDRRTAEQHANNAAIEAARADADAVAEKRRSTSFKTRFGRTKVAV